MGIFSSKSTTTISVSSSVYNLAGDEANRPHFLRNTVIGGVLGERGGIGDTLREAYALGPGTKLKNYARWARTNGYADTIGASGSRLDVINDIPPDSIAPHIPHPVGTTVFIERAEIDRADFSYWAEQYIAEHCPEKLFTDYKADFVTATRSIVIDFTDGSQASFTPTDFDITGDYLYAAYQIQEQQGIGPLLTGSLVTLAAEESFPSTVGWEALDYTFEIVPATLETRTTAVVNYSDGSPGSTTTTTTSVAGEWTDQAASWTQTVTSSDPGPDNQKLTQYWMYQDTVGSVAVATDVVVTEEVLSGGVVKTTTVTAETDEIVYTRTHRTDSQVLEKKIWGNTQVFIYKRGSGNTALDALWGDSWAQGDFLPVVPIRINNSFVADSSPTSLYPLTKKAFRKATGGKLDKILTELKKNPSLDQLDYVFSVFGVSLNAKDMSARRYIYEFFSRILQGMEVNGWDYDAWTAQWEAANASWQAWITWRQNLDAAIPEPVRLPYPGLPKTTISVGSGMGYDISITWNLLREEEGSGLLKPDAKPGDLWFTSLGSVSYSALSWGVEGDVRVHVRPDAQEISTIALNYQVSSTQWKRIVISGLVHKNTVYQGNFVEIKAEAALGDSSESGFIIPLHESIYREIGLKHSTQMATACCYLVINVYEIHVTKSKWYQSAAFMVIIIVVAIALAVVTGGGSLGAAAGMLGTNAAVGTAMGFAAGTMAAAVAGAIANAVAAMIVTTIITKVAQAVFGDKVGAVVGAIASFVAVSAATNYATGADSLFSLEKMATAENLIKLTMAVGDGVAGFIQAGAQEKVAKTADEIEDTFTQYRADSEAIQDKMNELLGSHIINPMMFVEGSPAPPLYAESPDLFLHRTLMTGSDIADLSYAMVYDFVKATLNTNPPGIA